MEQLDLFSWRPRAKAKRRKRQPCEWKIVAVREVDLDRLPVCVEPEHAVKYWTEHIASAAHYNPDVECFAVLLLNVKHRIKGYHLVSIGSLNETIAHPREVFRAAVIGAAYSVILMHNHPSGDPTPSQSDIQVTRVFVEAGKLLRIDVQDHVIIGYKRHYSLREKGGM